MATPNEAAGASGLIGAQLSEPSRHSQSEDDAFEAGVDNAVTLVAMAIANRLSTNRVAGALVEYMDGFCSWLDMEAENIRAVVALLSPDRVKNHDVSDFLDQNTDLTPIEVTVLIGQIASLGAADGIDTVLNRAGVPSREELLALADYLEELAQKLSVQEQSNRATGGHSGEPATMTNATVGTGPEPTSVAEQRSAAPAPIGHGVSHVEMAMSTASPRGTAGTRHAETARQPGHIERRR